MTALLRSLALGTAALLTALLAPASAQEITGLDGWSIFLDPGHSQNENVGYASYSEARKVLRVGLALKEMLETRTDIDGVFISRTNDAQQVSLSQRTDAANASGADYFHSIHSNAAGPTTNYAFVLWAQLRNGNEPNPPYAGGREMAETMGTGFGEAMRIPTAGTNGGFGECDFYGASSCGTGVKGSRNFVQRNTLMPSTLSEAGFHTSTLQNPRNMNAEWKRLEATAMFWAILDYNGVARPADRIAAGIIRNGENGQPINGATISLAGQSYTTDTFESLFNQYTNDPELLRNGFYYLEDVAPGTHAVTVTAEDYGTFTGSITMLEGEFTFLDVDLISTVPPVVASSSPVPDQIPFRITDPIEIEFSRPMDRASVEAAFSLVDNVAGAPVPGAFDWEDDDTGFTFTPEASLAPQTVHSVTIAGTALGQAGQALDGDGDGTGGDEFFLVFTTGFPDTEAPRIVAGYPTASAGPADARPVVTATYSERILPASLDGIVTLRRQADNALVASTFRHHTIGERSTVSVFPEADLQPSTSYRLSIQPGVEDLFLNVQNATQGFAFTTRADGVAVTPLETFEDDVATNWWVPQQSGSTTGIVTDSTDSGATTERAMAFVGEASLRIDYGWDLTASPRLLRQFVNGGPARAVSFGTDRELRVYVFGDGSGTLVRFAVDDASSTEVSPWTAVDWFGWRPVTWDLSTGETGTWIGDGVLNPPLRFDSFQMSDDGGTSAQFGQIWIDDLELRQSVTVANESGGEAVPFRLHAPAPNPVRGQATLRFDLATASDVTATVYSVTGAEVARLAVARPYASGSHAFTWDASSVAAGVYVVRVTAGLESATQRLVVVR